MKLCKSSIFKEKLQDLVTHGSLLHAIYLLVYLLIYIIIILTIYKNGTLWSFQLEGVQSIT